MASYFVISQGAENITDMYKAPSKMPLLVE
jgi:hypothetical protein